VSLYSGDEVAHRDDNFVAKELYGKVRVLCWLMTGPKNHETKAKHVKATWGRRCNKLVFMSSKPDASLPAIALNVKEGRDNLWAKTKQAYIYLYEHHRDEADWFLKADDDTYVVVENLRHMLEPYNTSQPIYFGCKFKPYVRQGYMSGGAGYVLSKEAVRRFVKKGMHDRTGEICRTSDNAGDEDVEMGKCLENLGVEAGDSRDSTGRGRFFPFVPEDHLTPNAAPDWYHNYNFYPLEEGMGCCSDSAISFHYVSPNQMYVMEYLIYHLLPYGIDRPSATISQDQVTTSKTEDAIMTTSKTEDAIMTTSKIEDANMTTSKTEDAIMTTIKTKDAIELTTTKTEDTYEVNTSKTKDANELTTNKTEGANEITPNNGRLKYVDLN